MSTVIEESEYSNEHSAPDPEGATRACKAFATEGPVDGSALQMEHMGLKCRRLETACNDKVKKVKVCAVCGDRAIGYNFDAVTCESCKAFFRRNALKDEDYHRCSHNNACEINFVSRRFCQKCRLKKCLQVGMKKEWIETEDKLQQRKRKRIEKNKRKGGNLSTDMQRAIPNTYSTSSSERTATSDDDMVKRTRYPRTSEEESVPSAGFQKRLLLHSISAPVEDFSATRDRDIGVSESKSEIRQTVIRCAPATSSEKPIAHASPTNCHTTPTQLPSDNDSNDELSSQDDVVMISKTVLLQLINTCKSCCAQACHPLPPVVERASSLVLSRSISDRERH